MNTMLTRILIVFGLVAVLGGVNHAIYGKEHTIKNGVTLYLELAPVDPRSLMQGDYMALRFKLAESIEAARKALIIDGQQRDAVLVLDGRQVATLATGNEGDGLRLRYRIRKDQVWLGTNAYFFEEGTAQRFVSARYGEFKLNRDSGDAVLVGLRDEHLQPL